MTGPLFDTLFRPTTAEPPATAGYPITGAHPGAASVGSAASVASAAPVRVTGTRTRAGNAMNRTRTALLAGAARAVEVSGTKITMAQVAAAAGVAKATLYNHFRTREAVLDALLLAQVDALVQEQDGKPLQTALVDTALTLSRQPLCRGLARVEPATLAAVARIDLSAPGWQHARDALADALAAAGRDGVDTVLRWLASYVVSPGDPATIADDVAVLVTGLPVVDAAAEPARDTVVPTARPA